jgi:hypothetical protein
LRSPARFVRHSTLIRRRPCLALAVASPLLLLACATTVFPPERVTDPAQVGVLDHGHHSSLIMEVQGGRMRRYSYGDWRWYALRQTGPAEASSALFWPSQAALGRKALPGPFSPMAVAQEVKVPIEHALYLTVETRDVQRLVNHLDRIFDENMESRVYNPAYDLEFVHHPHPYTMLHNSNRVVGEWLERLECRLEGSTLFSIWRLGNDSSASVLADPSARSAERHSTDGHSEGPRAGGT